MCNYKGMLYPLQLDSAENGNSARGVKIEESTKPLVDLCSEKIVLDGSSTLRALDVIPSELCYSLMKAALLNTRDRAIEVCANNCTYGNLSFKTRFWYDR